MYYIYLLKDLNNNIKYVGQTKDPSTRKRDHKNSKPQHIFEIVEKTIIAEDAKNLEINYINNLIHIRMDGINLQEEKVLIITIELE